ncbi:MAG TPA: ribose 5-phosphate isomerase B [Syntrophomonadaceae bacterium]|jgi:ribose 5-phosphate isomerase B|nr:ribose 5-phosphate isomerase B [Syntrophomonadaceae bacterium]
MQIIIGSDHAGVDMKKRLIEFLQQDGHQVIDCGTYSVEAVDYPDIAVKVCQKVIQQQLPGIVICGTGIGISIAANKINGIRAALCYDAYTASLARRHNDANVLALGARIIGPGLAQEIVKTFINTPFEGGRHQRRVNKIMELEAKS